MSSSVKGTRRLVTTVNLTVKLMHHMSILSGPLPPPPSIGKLLGEFDVVPDVLAVSTPGGVIGGLGVGTLVGVAIVI